MKKIAHLILLAGLASQLAAQAQTNPVTDAKSMEDPSVIAAAPAPAIPPAAEVLAPVKEAPPTETTPPAPLAPGATEANATTDTNAPAVTGGEVIPLVFFDDIEITTAIKSLTRMAGINYMLDPKIGYGQLDQNGQAKPEPKLSIRWENITAEKALLALLDNYGLQVVHDKKTGIDRITLKDPAALTPLITRVIQLKYSDPLKIKDAVDSVLTDKRSKSLPDNRTSQLVVTATEPEQIAVDTMIAQLDRPTKQVLIETRFVEVQSNPKTSKGIDWSGTFAAQNVSFGNGVTGAKPSATGGGSGGSAGSSSSSVTSLPGTPVTTTTPGGGYTITTTPGSSTATTLSSLIQGSQSPGGLSFNTLSGLTPAIGFLNADGVQAVISFLNSSKDAQTISTPRLVTLDNQMARIDVSRGIPVINVTAGTVQTAGGSSVTYSNVGTSLEVTPRISANDYIWLKVIPSISTSPGDDTRIIAGQLFSAPLFDQRRIETQVLIPNANTLVMGGLVNDSPASQTTKVPILGDIPYLGYAFRSETKTVTKDNLIIFITPTIIRDADFQPAKTDFLKSSPESKSPVNFNPDSAWDSTKPYDWSKKSGKTSSEK